MNKTKIIFQQPVFINHPDREPKFSKLLHEAVGDNKTVVICVDGLSEKEGKDFFEPRSKTPAVYVLHKDDKGMFVTKYPDKVNDDIIKIVDPILETEDYDKIEKDDFKKLRKQVHENPDPS